MKQTFETLITKIAEGQILSRIESRMAFEHMMDGNASESQIGAFLMGLRVRGETVDEITGAAQAIKSRVKPIAIPQDSIDTCGTGGTGIHSYNISTAVAITLAAGGLSVAKHGNRAVSSKSGSADVLEALGVNITADQANIEKTVATLGIGFMLAPQFHNAMRHLRATRAALGIRTIVNLLGPLCNPAGAKYQMIGVFGREWTAPLAAVSGQLGAQRVWVVHGADGLDELSLSGPSFVSEYYKGTVNNFTLTPQDAGLRPAPLSALIGGDAVCNAQALRDILDGAKNAYRDCVILNASAAFMIAGRADDLKQGAEMAAAALDSGAAKAKLEQWIPLSHG